MDLFGIVTRWSVRSEGVRFQIKVSIVVPCRKVRGVRYSNLQTLTAHTPCPDCDEVAVALEPANHGGDEHWVAIEGTCPQCGTQVGARIRRPDPALFDLVTRPEYPGMVVAWARLDRLEDDRFQLIEAHPDEPGFYLAWNLM